MKAVYIMQHGGPEVLRYGDLPDPAPRPDEVVVDTVAAWLAHSHAANDG
jgi:NADPH:quinone reductase-like Zn-dependent oxidoreductase